MTRLTCSYIKLFAWSMGLDFVIESISRHSPLLAAAGIVERPVVFLLNSLLVFLPFACIFLFKRRVFFFSLLSLLWLSAGCINGFLLTCRTTPFTAADLRLIKYGLNVMTTYMNWLQIGCVIAGTLLALAALVLLWKKAPLSRMFVKKETAFFVPAVCLFLTLGTVSAFVEEGIVARQFGNIGSAYRDYGFVYCFSNSVFNVGIRKPDAYDTDAVAKIEEEFVPEGGAAALPEGRRPNIIMLQLESFFDPQQWENNPLDKDPVPYFRSLTEDYPSGYLSVPSVGAGTANTEFECITGMNLDFFGPGEYPYKTVLRKTACESVAFDLKNLGYGAHAIHNNEGTFYDRNHVFSQLGFDTFTPIEYMTGIERNPIGWCKDKVLVKQITDTLSSTPDQDFIYAISVQGHGAYPDFEYYGSQIEEMDGFIRNLTQEVEKLDEPTVIVMYGDHLPGFAWEAEEMKNDSLFQTQYVIWNNMDLPNRKTDLEAYQLSAYVLDMLNIHEGTLMRYHQRYLADGRMDPEAYLGGMEVLEYDMLYGDHEVYGGVMPFAATEMRMGIHPIEIESVTADQEAVYLFGENFNEYSVVYIDGDPVKTEFVQPDLLAVHDIKPEKLDGKGLSVRQVGRDKVALGEEVVYRPADPVKGGYTVKSLGFH